MSKPLKNGQVIWGKNCFLLKGYYSTLLKVRFKENHIMII